MTMKLGRAVAAAAILAASFPASAAVYEFDTLTKYEGGNAASITGIPRNSSTPLYLPFYMGSEDNACIPIFLLMLEKPGRYYLTVEVVDTTPPRPLSTCTLSLRE